MKSPLVEALRQASDGSDASESTESAQPEEVIEDAPGPRATERPADPDELQLMEPGDEPTADRDDILPIDGDGIPAGADGILPIDGGGIPAVTGGILPIDGDRQPTGERTDADFHETTSLQISDAEASSPAQTHAHSAMPPLLQPVSHAGTRSGISRLGFYSPLICVLLVAAAAGTYFAYQGVTGWYQNRDLETLSSQIDASANQDPARSHDTDGIRNRFRLIIGPQTTAQRDASGESRGGAAVVGHERQPGQQSEQTRIDDIAFDVLNAAYLAYERGDFAAAEAAYRHALQIAPHHPNALQGLAAILHRAGRLDESLQHYEMLLSVEPGNSVAAVALLARGGDSPDSATESEIKHLMQRHPNSAPLHFALGALFARHSRWAQARNAFDTALRLDAANADYLFNLAVSLEHLDQYADARYYYELALEAANATSMLDSDIVVARIEQLALLADPENLAR